ncbi:MAG: hypothetical protein ACKO81_18950 [Planctomycetota bacterium]
MKRNGWLVCLLLGALCGVSGVAWSRSHGEQGQGKPEEVAADGEVCATGSGEACNCSTGLNRASLMKSAGSKAAEQK